MYRFVIIIFFVFVFVFVFIFYFQSFFSGRTSKLFLGINSPDSISPYPTVSYEAMIWVSLNIPAIVDVVGDTIMSI
jgi:hypothetical protein